MNLLRKTIILLVTVLWTVAVFAQMQTRSVGLQLRHSDITLSNLHDFLNETYSMNGAFTFDVVRDYVDEIGYRHTDYQQYYNDIKIEHAILIVHSLASKVTSVNGSVAVLDQMPAKTVRQYISSSEAVTKARMYIAVKAEVSDDAERLYTKVLNADGSETYVLAYRTRVTSFADGKDEKVYVDAYTGDIVKTVNMVQHAAPEIVDTELETYYSGTRNIRMTKYDDGSYALADSVNGIFTYNGKTTKNDTLRYPLTTNEQLFAHIEHMIEAGMLKKSESLKNWDILCVSGFNINGVSPDHEPTIGLENTPTNYKLLIRSMDSTEIYMSLNHEFANQTLPLEAKLSKNVELERDSSYIIDIMTTTLGLFWYDTTLVSFVLKLDKEGNISYPGDSIQGSLVVVNQPNHALDAHFAMEQSYKYFKEKHNLNSFDNKGSKVHTFVDLDDAYFGQLGTNAWAWASEPFFVATGRGDAGHLIMDKVVAFDMLVHEFTHLVVQNNGREGLEAKGESGAINEAISDCMAVACDYYTNGDYANWQIGEDVMLDDVPNMRDMENPKNSGGGFSSMMARPNPDTYNGEHFVDPSNIRYDIGGIHINCGILNYWFYLLSEGGDGVNDKNFEYKVDKIGIDNAAKLLMYTIFHHLTPAVQYRDMYNATLSAADVLWGVESEEYSQVVNAWKAVNVDGESEYVDVPDVEASDINIYTDNGYIFVDADSSRSIEVYSSAGQLIYTVTAQRSGTTSISLPGVHGVVIVKVDGIAQKVII